MSIVRTPRVEEYSAKSGHKDKTQDKGRVQPTPPRGRKEIVDAVLDAATILFARHGAASVSVRDIARLARINHALLHRHFGSKSAVIDAVVERTVQRLSSI